ncbi:hypothetical protein BN18_0713 [Klebsiella pneumoniae subsp. pneumoniae ST512-K30BO]|uniref:Uncharacterized protein n=2 Tax=Klebsiella pneumoniae TaxID=573 RepID=A0A023JMA9_KLEPN|nr:putative transposase [Klebsiella pneumoniae subsp. pneumoniae Kp13]AHJ80497.1 hypothetical protein [Klebsiella pneumoniae subsp. pneumoniae]AHM78617.1 hypothetical protein KPNJ2_01837 [Klebsiella pneumoniae 30684/NJST258_2]AHM84279.1 hypothetical protein KPNJ1_01873 [Klebsiella pneumoniae 30660/NJST258_1]AWF08342.1 hypothetical protein CSC25_1858 [Klebsiella pneumoniae]EPS09104.1 hypothetical protein KKPNMP14_32350 [Klebsiella pneumoniae subsp. pneumoniae MP14]CCM85759.1 hypothetical prote
MSGMQDIVFDLTISRHQPDMRRNEPAIMTLIIAVKHY